MIGAVLACDINGGIGKNGTLPWPRISEDLKRFRELTTRAVVVMGRNTWDDPLLPKPLAQRINVVITNGTIPPYPDTADEVATANGDMGLILNQLQDHYRYQRIFVIGGASVIQQSLPYIDQIYLTKINKEFDCDQHIDYNSIKQEFSRIIQYERSWLLDGTKVEYYQMKRPNATIS